MPTFLPSLKSKLLHPCLCLLIAAFLPPAAPADDWPQWRGTGRDGKSAETGLWKEWPEGGPPLAWTGSGLGTGYASVSVADGRIFTIGDLPEGQFAFGLKEDGGAQLWKTKVGPVNEMQYLGSRSTPTVAGSKVYVLATEGDLYCLEAATGKVVWQRNLPKDFGATMMKAQGTYDWRFSESPLVDGDKVVVTPGAKDAALVALKAATGEEVWRTALPDLGAKGTDGAGYSSVVVSRAGGVKQYVQLLGRGLVGVDAATGKFLWGYNPVANGIANIPTPLIFQDFVFASTGYGTGAALVRLSAAQGGAVEAEEVYFLEADTFQNHHGGMILHGGHVYAGTGHNRGFPMSLELASGELNWGPIRNEGKSSASIAYADGHLYYRYQNGLMVLVEANPAEYREKGSFMIPDVQRESWPHPVIANGKLFLREQDKLYAYDLKARKKEGKGKAKGKKAKGKKASAAKAAVRGDGS